MAAVARSLSSRRGSGVVLGLVALLVAILLLMGISQAFFSETVLDDAGAEQVGALALTAAESALEELQLAVRSGVNDPASPLHPLFRRRLAQNPDRGFELPAVATPAAARLAAQSGLTVVVEPPRITVRTLFHVKKFTYNEHYGVVRYRVHAYSTRTRPRVERWLTAAQEYKVVSASMPPPFDQVSLFVVNAEPIAGGGEVNRAMEVFAGVRRTWSAYLGTLIRTAPGAAREIGALKRSFDRIPPLEEPGAAPGGPRPVHRMPGELTAFIDPAFSAKTPQVPGAAVDLATPAPRWRREVEQLDTAANDKVGALVRAGEAFKTTGKPPERKVLEDAVAAMQVLADRAFLYQDAIRQWQDMMGEYYGQGRAARLTDLDNLSAGLLERKSFFTVRETDAGGDANAALAKLRETLRANTGTDALNGIVWVENPKSALDLTALPPVKGRVIFAVSGDARVGNLAGATAADLAGVVCHGTMTLAGDVTGALAAMKDLKIEGAATVRGVLVVNAPPPGSLSSLTLMDDPALRAGAAKAGAYTYQDKYLYVGVAPVLLARTIDRSTPRD